MALDLRFVNFAGAVRMITWDSVRQFSRAFSFRLRNCAVVAVFVLPLGCSAPGDKVGPEVAPEARRSMVAERVNARWAALIKGDLDAAYLFLSPASREVVSLAEFKAKTRGSGFREVKVDSVECDPGICKVRLYLTYDHRLMKGMMTPLTESWVVDQGQVWYVWQQ
jgi:hypothetical protein